MNNNGFADMAMKMRTLANVNHDVSLKALEEAATYFAKKLKDKIPVSSLDKRKHLRDYLKVVVSGDEVYIGFEEDGWYWYLVEHGHLVAAPGKRLRTRTTRGVRKRLVRRGSGKKHVTGRFFFRNTWDAEGEKVVKMLQDSIIKKMEG